MPDNLFQLNYDEMTSIAKQFKDDGEDMGRLHSETRQRVRDLYKEWIGEAAEKFFEEMETQLLPALQRLSLALFQTQDVSNEIMKIIQGADEETAGYFKDPLSGDSLQGAGGTDDFGAGKFGEAIGTPASGVTSAPDDFGASKFGEATPGQPGHDSTPNDPGSGQQQNTNSSQGSGGDSSDKHQKDQQQQTPTDTKSTGGGGGGSTSSSSQGLKGDLKNMGAGLSDVAPQNAESGVGPGGGSTNMPDHVYSSDSASNTGGTQSQEVTTGSGNADQPAPGVGGAAAGVAGSVGAAAAGAAAKIVKEQQDKTSE